MVEKTGKVDVKKAERGGSELPSVFDWSRPLTDLRGEVDRVFESFMKGWPQMPRASFAADWRELSPSVDVSESDEAYEIAVELPGMDEQDVELTLRDDMLTLSGEKKSEKEEKKKDYVLSERSYGSFKRGFRLPTDINPDKISAELKQGIMTITLPKTAEAQENKKKIAITSK